MEEALRNSESLYHSLVETMPQNVFRKDLQGRFTFANRQYCEHYQCKQEDILGKTDFDFFPKELAEKYQKDDRNVMETGQNREIIEEHHPFGQEKTTVQVVKTPLYDHAGKIIGLQGIFWDITEKNARRNKSAARPPNCPAAARNCAPKMRSWRKTSAWRGEIQFAMLPQQYPNFPRTAARRGKALFNSSIVTSRRKAVSGDFFSVSALSDTEAGVFICDVTGHGIRAALVTAMIRALAEELKPIAHDPGEFLRKLNSDLCSILKNTGSPMLTTAFYLVADWPHGGGAFRQCRASQAAAHPPLAEPGRAAGQCLAAAASPPSGCLKTRLTKPGDHPGAGRFRDALHRRPLRGAGAK